MIVAQHEEKFAELSHFATSVVNTEVEKSKRFKRGL